MATFTARVAIAAETAIIAVTPASGSIDAPFRVVVSHVLPGSRVRVTARRPDVHGHYWTAVGDYFADADGQIDVAAAPSLGGSYEGVSAHGLWCSALPVAPEELKAYIADLPQHPERGTAPELDVKADYTVELTASIDGKAVATTTAERSYEAGPSVEEVSTPEGVRGLFFPARADARRGIPVVVVAGSGGGLPQAQAALLAAE